MHESCESQRRKEHDQRADGIREQVADVEDLGHGALRERGKKKRGQRKLDDELAQHPHIGMGKQAYVAGQVAEGNDEVNGTGNRKCVQHLSFGQSFANY